MDQQTVVIAAATRGRHDMFEQLLDGLAGLRTSPDLRFVFVFVENDADFTIDALTRGFPDRTGHAAVALHQPELGIPFARNSALDWALDNDADWLCFIDDDEVPAADWVTELVDRSRADGLDLAGGPVDQLRPEGTLSWLEERVFDFNVRMAREREEKRSAGTHTNLHLATNNWIASVPFLRRTGLRFDEAMRFTGGTDTDLSRRAEDAGARLGWIPTARVSEELPRSRLTLRYIFQRSKSQTMAKYHIRFVKEDRSARARAAFHWLRNSLSGIVRLACWPLLGSYVALKGVRALGVGHGWLIAAIGQRSDLYKQVIRRS